MAREKERRDQKLMKDHRKTVKVQNKTIANRSNRAGVIKQINMYELLILFLGYLQRNFLQDQSDY
jgi:hypothetical protein